MDMDVQSKSPVKFLDDWFVDACLRHRIITEEELQEISRNAVDEPYFINLLLTRRLLGKNDIATFLKDILQIPVLNLDAVTFDPRAIELVPEEMCQNYNLIPVESDEVAIAVAMANPFDLQAHNQLRMVTRLYVRTFFAFIDDIQRKIADLYNPDKFLNNIISKTAVKHQVYIAGDDYLTDESPVVKLVNLILSDAIEKEASDVHIEPRQHDVVVRFRIDGILQKILEIPKNTHAALVSRIKIISALDISEKRKPQDGKAKIYVDETDFDLRISVLPTAYGEKVVIRILDKRKAKVSFEDLGVSEDNLQLLRQAFGRKEGLVLVTGPTGSGKTTTLYAALNQIKSGANNILTIEDPIEYQLEGINQVQVNEKAGISFATALRSFLRQDPDVILVGEIRDRETAEIAVQASLTGHLVLSTLHTNSALATITRLVDMGIDPFKVADSLQAIVAQRLVRRVCKVCAEVEETPQDPILIALKQNHPEATFYRAKGCQFCNFTGYRGRIGVYEILILDNEIRTAISHRKDSHTLQKLLRQKGFRTLQEDALHLVVNGVTDLAELKRAISMNLEEIATAQLDVSNQTIGLQKENAVSVLLITTDGGLKHQLQEHIVKQASWRFMIAEDIKQAFITLQTVHPQVVVLDVGSHTTEGIAFLQKFRVDLSRTAIPVIVLCNEAEQQNQLKALRHSADDYLIKPVTPEVVVGRIERFLRRQQKNKNGAM